MATKSPRRVSRWAARPVTLEVAALTAFVLVPAAHGLVLCKTPDGKTYAGDAPPAGCVVSSSYERNAPRDAIDGGPPAPEPAADSAADAQALTSRRRLEERVNQLADQLKSINRQISSVPEIYPSQYQTTDLYVRALHERNAVLSELYNQRGEIKIALDSAADEFKNLTEDFRRSRGSLPSWWGPLRCSQCS